MKKKFIIFMAVFSALLILLIVAASQMPISDEAVAQNHLERLGWRVDKPPVEVVKVQIPYEFDDVYIQYNQLQKQAGFDLTKHRGQTLTRYTFAVKNYDGMKSVRANVYVYQGKVVGGDLMSVALDGFMQPLTKRN